MSADWGDGIDLYPDGYRDEIARIVEALADAFAALDHSDAVLADHRYLAGDRLTPADVRLFPTLVRFDECYHTALRSNRHYRHQFEHLWPYLRDRHTTPGFAETVVMDHSKDQGYDQGEITPVSPPTSKRPSTATNSRPPDRHLPRPS